MSDAYASLGKKQENSTARGTADGTVEFEKKAFWGDVCDSSGNVLQEWKPKLGDNRFDIMPWKAVTNMFGNAVGDLCFDVQTSVNLKLSYGIPKSTAKKTVDLVSLTGLNKADPIAVEQARLFELASPGGVKNKTCDEWKQACALYPKARSLYIIMVYSDDCKSRKPFLFAPAYESFGKLLDKQHRSLLRKGRDVIWAHPTEGMTIYIEGEKDTFSVGGQQIEFVGYSAVEAEDRIQPYPMDIIDKIPALDGAIIIPTADDAYMALTGTNPGENIQEEAPVAEEFKPEGHTATTVVETPKVEVAKTPAPKVDRGFEDDLPF